MNSQNSCPPQVEWQRIVAEGFVDFSLGDLSAHLDACPDCQAAVESLLVGEGAWPAIAAELRQELPPSSVVCQRMLEDLKDKESFGLITPADFLSRSEANEGTLPGRVYCHHCLELVDMEASEGDAPGRCPLCWRVVGATGQDATLPDYDMSTKEVSSPREIQEYVQSLEKRARQERRRKPYHRGRFPVELLACLICVLGGFLFLVIAFLSGEGLMSFLVNGIFPAIILWLIGALCFIFWAK